MAKRKPVAPPKRRKASVKNAGKKKKNPGGFKSPGFKSKGFTG